MNEPSNVVPLRASEKTTKRDDGITERAIWACVCGCFSWRLFDDGHVQCAKCGLWSDDVRAVFDAA